MTRQGTTQSVRIASSADTLVARTAGSSVATVATVRSTTTTTTNDPTSDVPIPKTSADSARDVMSATTTPSVTPATAGASARRNTIAVTAPVLAPSASRIPISFRRRATSAESTPYTPTAASTNDSTANAVSRTVVNRSWATAVATAPSRLVARSAGARG